MSNGPTYEILNIVFAIFLKLLGFKYNMASAKFQGNRFRTDGEIGENHAILVHYIYVCLGIISFLFTLRWELRQQYNIPV